MSRDTKTRCALFVALVALAVAVRWLSTTPNFSAVAATTLIAGYIFRHRATAVCVTLLAMMISDYILGGYTRMVMFAVYGSLLFPIAWRGVLRAQLTPLRVGLGAVTSSLAFYLLTNLAVWYAWYPRNLAGLTSCFASALPFLANTLAGDLLFAATLFGAYALATRLQAAPQPAALPQGT